MSTKFPPSSPSRWDQSSEIIGTKNGVSTTHQLNILSDDYESINNNNNNNNNKSNYIINRNNNINLYPTPNPSSSTGVGIPSSPILSALDNHINNNEDLHGQFSFDSSFTKEIIEPETSTTNATTHNNKDDDMIPISINPNLTQHLIIGRKTSICDIQLPRLKNISRQHAIVTYNDHTNLVNITCLGTNGMVILFHSDIDFTLTRLSPRDNLTSYKIIPCLSPQKYKGKLLQRENELISFALLKNESIELPLVNNTILDFRQCRSIIQVTIPTSQDGDNDTETEDEMTLLSTKSDDFVHTPTKRLIPISTYSGTSPITEEVSMINQKSSPTKIVTPIVLSTKQEEPRTPKKLKQNSMINNVTDNNIRLNNMESPIVRDSNNEYESKVLKFRPLTQKFMRRTVSKLETDLLSKSVKMPKTPPKVMNSKEDTIKTSVKTPKKIVKLEASKVVKRTPSQLQKKSTNEITVNTKSKISPSKESNEIKIKLENKPEDKIVETVPINKMVNEPIISVKEEKKEISLPTMSSKEIHKSKNKRPVPVTSLDSTTSINNTKQVPKHKKKKKNAPIKYNEKDVLQDLENRKINFLEIQRIIINNLAYSNLQQTTLSQIREINNQTKSLTKIEIKSIIHDASCIGVIKRQGKDAAGKLLEEEYYYDLENDHDDERRSLIISLRGGRNSGLRSCRKTHKQYYWKKPPKK